MMKPKNYKIIIPLITSIGMLLLSGCGGGPGAKEIAKTCADQIAEVTTAFEDDPMMQVLKASDEKMATDLKMKIFVTLGIPIDVKNDKIVEPWDVVVLSKGSPIKSSGLKAVSVSVGSGKYSASANTGGASEVPAGTKVYPVIYKLVSKDKKHGGVPQEKYFYKDVHKKWASAKSEDLGLENSATYNKILAEYSKELEVKTKGTQ